ncbi:MAG: phosphate/phosphite/phosphonate ABC transporter substrate-binding protein [Candidatus Cloacimonadaceae bacterium]
MKKTIPVVFICIGLLLIGCSSKAPLGSKKNPIKMYFVPSLEANKVVSSGEAIANHLHKVTGYYFKVAVPTSYAAVIEAMGTNEADIAWLATYAYILAHDKYGAVVRLSTVRNGLSKYRGQFIARADGKVKKLEDIQGKVVAFTDAASTSGFIYPKALLDSKGIKPKEYFFAGGHPQAVLAVYGKRADVGCTYWSPPDQNGVPQDARIKLIDTYPDVLKKVSIIGFTDWIPNDTVTMRKDFPQEMQDKIVNALLDYVATPEGKKVMKELYDIDGLNKATDADYNIVRETLKTLGKSPSDFLK